MAVAEIIGGVLTDIGPISIMEEKGGGVDVCDSEEGLEEAAATPPSFFCVGRGYFSTLCAHRGGWRVQNDGDRVKKSVKEFFLCH